MTNTFTVYLHQSNRKLDHREFENKEDADFYICETLDWLSKCGHMPVSFSKRDELGDIYISIYELKKLKKLTIL